MEKIILTLVVVFVIGITSAQDKKGSSFGVKGGLNMSTISNVSGDGMSASSLLGLHIGVFGEFMLGNKFALQPELLYSFQGVKSTFEGENMDFKLNYINIPVMAKYYVAKSFSLDFGPQIGFLVSANAKSGGLSVSVKELFRTTDYGLNIGAGYDIGKNIMLSTRYYFGLSQIQKDLTPGESSSKNSVYSFSFGYKF